MPNSPVVQYTEQSEININWHRSILWPSNTTSNPISIKPKYAVDLALVGLGGKMNYACNSVEEQEMGTPTAKLLPFTVFKHTTAVK
jgi:hypothetical protein